MPIKILCPGCSIRLKMGDNHAGTTIECPRCDAPISIPIPLPVEPSPDTLNDGGEPTPPRRKVSFWAVGIGLLLCFFGVAVATYLLIARMDKTHTANPGTEETSPQDLPDSVLSFISALHETDGGEARIVYVEFLPVKGKMLPTENDKWGMAADEAKNMDPVFRPNKGKDKAPPPRRAPEPDLRVDGVYYVAFRRPVQDGLGSDNYVQRILFFMRPGRPVGLFPNPFAIVIPEADNWRDDVRDWVPDSK